MTFYCHDVLLYNIFIFRPFDLRLHGWDFSTVVSLHFAKHLAVSGSLILLVTSKFRYQYKVAFFLLFFTSRVFRPLSLGLAYSHGNGGLQGMGNIIAKLLFFVLTRVFRPSSIWVGFFHRCFASFRKTPCRLRQLDLIRYQQILMSIQGSILFSFFFTTRVF
jgi:hypothetical protein